MKKLFLASIAALFLATGTASAQHRSTPDEEHIYCTRYGSLNSKLYVECRSRLQELQQCFDATEFKVEMKLNDLKAIMDEEAGCMESVWRRYPQPMKGN
jgi:hypothetical protein